MNQVDIKLWFAGSVQPDVLAYLDQNQLYKCLKNISFPVMDVKLSTSYLKELGNDHSS